MVIMVIMVIMIILTVVVVLRTRSRWTTEDEIGHVAILCNGPESDEGFFITNDIIEGLRTVPFDPW